MNPHRGAIRYNRPSGRAARASAILFLVIASLALPASADPATEQQLLETVQGFYRWVIENGKETADLQPSIRDIPGTTRFELDTSTLPDFTDRFMRSGFFAAGFPAAVSRYYQRYAAEFAALPQAEFDQIAQDGRGPMMETEDTNLFFCAQEYEPNEPFVAGMRLKGVHIEDGQASALVVSPFDWETEFHFTRTPERWLISGYCEFL